MNTISLSAQFASAGPALPTCPYRGLMPYTEDDADFFFGRDRDTRLIIDNLKAYRLTVLYGDSGVGKSSVLRAGVLQRMNDAEKESVATFGVREAVIVYCNNWRDDPLTAVAERIRDDISTAFPNADLTIPDRLEAAALAEVCDLLDADLYLVLDQFDEYFLYHGDDPSDGAFPTALAGLITSCVRVNILIAIREDALVVWTVSKDGAEVVRQHAAPRPSRSGVGRRSSPTAPASVQRAGRSGGLDGYRTRTHRSGTRSNPSRTRSRRRPLGR